MCKKSANEELKEYKSIKRQILTRLRRQYWKYIEEMICDDSNGQAQPTMKFWPYSKQKRTENSGILPLKDDGKLVTDDKEKAEILNRQFQTAFSNKECFTVEEFVGTCAMPDRTATISTTVTSTSQRLVLSSSSRT